MWNSIKSILKDNKTKCVIIEDGEPKYVVIPFKEYQQLQKDGNNSIMGENPQISEEEVNGEMQDIKTLEDLPF